MIMDLVFRKQEKRKGFGTSQRKVLSLHSVFQQTGAICAGIKSDILSTSLRSSVKIFLIGTKYPFIE